jgi:hypothetical protein
MISDEPSDRELSKFLRIGAEPNRKNFYEARGARCRDIAQQFS